MAFKLSPELSDGQNPSIVKDADLSTVTAMMVEWCNAMIEYGAPGESCQVEYIEMTDAEIEALPDL